MTSATEDREPVVAARDEAALLAEIDRILLTAPVGTVALVGPGGDRGELPASLCRVLVQAVRELVIGNGVAVLPAAAELTTQRAADLLNVSRPYLISLLERGEIRYRTVGTHRRVKLSDLVAYQAKRDAERRRRLDALTRDGDELGLYRATRRKTAARAAETPEPFADR